MHRNRRSQILSYKKKKKITPEMVREVFSWIFYTFVAVFMALLVVMAFGMRTKVIGESMEPTLYHGQDVLINRIAYKFTSPKSGDIIAFLPNGNVNSHDYIKRVVAVPGDTVQIKDGKLYVNGQEQDSNDSLYDKMEDAGIASGKIKLAADEYFVLGDNRNSSEDSRSANIGTVKSGSIIGKIWYHYGGEEGNTGFVKN
ncbi:MAG: signal peptidase I [Butyrivibrio sp.]|nr:signal peptidase I [Butyrivibrio sp.]